MSDLSDNSALSKAGRAFGSKAVLEANRIDRIIDGFETRKRTMSPFEPSDKINRQISELRQAKEKVLAGEVDDARPALRTALPKAKYFSSKENLSNPLDTIKALPTDKAERDRITDGVFDFAVNRISGHLKNFGAASLDHPVQYTQKMHVSMIQTLAFLWAENRILQKAAEENRARHNKHVELNARASRALIDSLLKRVDALEAMPRQEYKGIWSAEFEYREAQCVTYGGSTWYCWRKTMQQPGTGADWQLMTKKGRDAK
jgi:hypothetical protein